MEAVANEITADLAAKRCGVKPKQVVRWIKIGLKGGTKLKARKLGRTWLIEPADLDEFSRKLTEAALAK